MAFEILHVTKREYISHVELSVQISVFVYIPYYCIGAKNLFILVINERSKEKINHCKMAQNEGGTMVNFVSFGIFVQYMPHLFLW
jgi:hypothetical protein